MTSSIAKLEIRFVFTKPNKHVSFLLSLQEYILSKQSYPIKLRTSLHNVQLSYCELGFDFH